MTQRQGFGEQVKALEHLQELDLKIDQANRTKNSLPASLRAMDDSLVKLRRSVQDKQNAMAEIEKVQRQTSAALDLNRDRLTRSNTRLEGIKNSQEFQAVNKEIDQLKKFSGTLEEQSKKSNQEIDGLKKELDELNSQLQKVQGERDTQAETVSGQGSKLESEVGALASERKKYTDQIEQRILAQYDRIRMAKGGLGFVSTVGGRCKGCHMMLPPQLFNEIRKANAVHCCPSCHRILFVPTQEGGSGPGPTGQAG